MKRLSPAVVLIAATAFVIAIDAIIVVAPQALADPAPSATISAAPAIADASPTVGAFNGDPLPAGTLYFADPNATPVPTPTPSPTLEPTPTPKPTPVPTPYDTVWNARTYAKNRLGAAGYACIDNVFTKESKWNPYAGTPTGAYGIPQAYPGSKMATFGSNWRTSPLTQVKWGIWYVTSRYGSACAAWDFWQANGWY